MHQKTRYLKIKIKSLADEAQIIRQEERKVLGFFRRAREEKHRNAHLDTYVGLRTHRRHDVRDESRAAQLAYAFVRDIPYSQVEKKCKVTPDWERIERIAGKFSADPDPRVVQQKFAEWKDLGQQSLDSEALVS